MPIKEMPRYEMDLEDEKDPKKMNKVLVDEKANLLEALENNGVSKSAAGIRLYNQKYYSVHWDDETKTMYLKKVNCALNSGKRRRLRLHDQELHSDRHLQCHDQNAQRCATEPRGAQQESGDAGERPH
jgi:hypothetical protein